MPHSLSRPPFAVDSLYSARNPKDFLGESSKLNWTREDGIRLGSKSGSRYRIAKGTYTSQAVPADFEFHEILPSWNIDLDEARQGYRIHLRVQDIKGKWSPWFYLGSGGIAVNKSKLNKRLKSASWGEVDVDYLSLKKPAVAFQYQIELSSKLAKNHNSSPVTLNRFFAAYSNTAGDQALHARTIANMKVAAFDTETSVSVPYRSQLTVPDKAMRGQICCPTCVSMALEYLGVNKKTEDVATEAFDPETKLYGIWPRASQAAASNGMEAWVQRFRTHDEVKSLLAAGQPVMASIKFKGGALKKARYKNTNGHLILLIGMRANGDYIVNDPASKGPGGAESDYSAEDIDKVWLEKGGVGIIIKKPEMT